MFVGLVVIQAIADSKKWPPSRLTFSVSVHHCTDPFEISPKKDQAIVLNITKKEIPNKVYIEELNKRLKNDNSFLHISRVTRDRVFVVFDSASMESMLLEQVEHIETNND